MYLIGLTGGIASGKSTVATRLAEHGAVHIDADQLAREAVEPGTDALQQISDTFGSQLILPDGTLDRPALGALVFGHPDELAKLNAIVHPAVLQLTRSHIAEAEQHDPNAIVVYDVPLLAESNLPHRFNLIVVVNASDETRIDRLIANRGMSRSEAHKRIASQASEAERLALADIVIDSDGTLAETLGQADALWSRLVTLSGSRGPAGG
ncbi:dephospho-CoA kinase, long form [Subtercola sp. PAMC28395]|uniref:dephospho-CoA kinase n=1 Tax=Subtercola sp. PAMC28395 TaxID=2846775 RepID=UPI001C0E2D54|nr:dephospho-CoA kinase [Subtercola sp. PAMC28395]QWT23296.1 dephospho-CoA kinase, long form [Subtercola sp. PAMC28395]